LLLQAIQGEQNLAVEFNQGGAGLAEAAMVLGEVTQAREVLGGERAQAGLAGLAPGENGGGVPRSVGGSAVAGGLAAAGFQFIDGALEELAQGQDLFQGAMIVRPQGGEGVAETAGAVKWSGHRQVSSLCYIS
jgi:hypothetical protein